MPGNMGSPQTAPVIASEDTVTPVPTINVPVFNVPTPTLGRVFPSESALLASVTLACCSTGRRFSRQKRENRISFHCTSDSCEGHNKTTCKNPLHEKSAPKKSAPKNRPPRSRPRRNQRRSRPPRRLSIHRLGETGYPERERSVIQVHHLMSFNIFRCKVII